MTMLRRLDHEVAGHAQLDVAALEGQVGAAAHQGDVLLRGDQHVLLAGADLHALLGLQADVVLLRLQQHRPWWVIWRSSPPWANRPMSLPALITTFCPAVTCWFCRATLSTCSPAARVRLAGVAAAIPAGPLKAIAGLPPLLLPDSSLAPWPRSRTASWRVCCGAASCPTPWCSPA